MSRPPSRSRATIFVAASVLALAVLADDDPAAPLYRDAYRLVLDEQWTAAAAGMEALVGAHPKSPWADDAAFWSCYSREKAGAGAEPSFRCYLALVRERPASDWEDDARRALARLGGDLAAEGRPQHLADLRDGEDFASDEDADGDLIQVLMALADVGDERSVATIVERSRRTGNPHSRERIARILGEIDAPAARAELVRLVDADPSTEVRRAALRALGEAGGADAIRLLGAVASDPARPEELREAAIRGLGEQGGRAAVEVLGRLATGGDARVAPVAIRALGEAGDESGEAWRILRSLVESAKSEEVREAALRAVAEIGGPEALALLRGAALAGSPFAARRMGELDEPGLVAALVEIATKATDEDVRMAAVHALGETHDAGTVAALADLARTGDPELQRAAVRALGETDEDAAVPLLLDLARSGDPRVRRDAARALGELGTPAAREALIELLGKDTP